MPDNTRSCSPDGAGCLFKRLSAAFADMRLTITLLCLGVALLFFATLTGAAYGEELSSQAYFGSLIAIWQYPAEWPAGHVLSTFWLPLPGAPLLAAAALLNLLFAGWKNRRRAHGLSGIGLALTHVGVLTVLAGYAVLLFSGSVHATPVVVSGSALIVVGLVLHFFPEFWYFISHREKAPPTAEVLSPVRQLNRNWIFAPLMGIFVGAIAYFTYGPDKLARIYMDTELELMPLVLYIPALAVFCIHWMRGKNSNELHRRIGFPLLSAAITMHTILPTALAFIRMRPPVTDLHSTLIVAGWVGALLAYYVERQRKDGIAGSAAVIIGTVTLLFSHFCATADFSGALNPMIDSRLWLALHVCTITAGYGAVLVAVVLANMRLVKSLAGISEDRARGMTSAIRSALATGLIFCTAGTLLGGLWAERAWGRFWGWDPKENAALMLVLWCAIVLHARRGNLAGEKGFAQLAAAAGLVLAWSWVGTNLLGSGLHSYGFTQGNAWFLGIYAIAQVALILAARKAKKQNI